MRNILGFKITTTLVIFGLGLFVVGNPSYGRSDLGSQSAVKAVMPVVRLRRSGTACQTPPLPGEGDARPQGCDRRPLLPARGRIRGGQRPRASRAQRPPLTPVPPRPRPRPAYPARRDRRPPARRGDCSTRAGRTSMRRPHHSRSPALRRPSTIFSKSAGSL